MSNIHQVGVTSPVWFQSSWDGPRVETRPEQAGSEWPQGAVERVTFTREAFPDASFPERFPFTEFFGDDGWPLLVPAEVKKELDTRMQAELHRYPWTRRPEAWSAANWLDFAADYDEFLYFAAETRLLRGLMSAGVLPQPNV